MKPIDMVTLKSPKSPVSEVYRTLRTSIKFASFEKDIKTIVITSPGPDEGKSTISANLGITMAQAGSKVLILECDLRNPTVHKIFVLSNIAGVTNILVESMPYSNYVNDIGVPNLGVITCGPKPPNPAEILGSSRMKNLLQELRNDYDYVLIDTPPVLAVTDAAILSAICDGTVLVLGSGEAVIDGAVKAKEILESVKANIIGVVLNKVKAESSGGYYRYYHYYYDDEPKKAKKRKRMHPFGRRG